MHVQIIRAGENELFADWDHGSVQWIAHMQPRKARKIPVACPNLLYPVVKTKGGNAGVVYEGAGTLASADHRPQDREILGALADHPTRG
jgi:hypothetical protein